MKKKWIGIIILLTSLSLGGIVFTQLFWVKNAVTLRKEQLEHRLMLGLKSVLNQLVAAESKQTLPLSSCGMICGLADTSLIVNFSPQVLDSLIRDEFSNLTLNEDFVYGIWAKHNGSLIFASSSRWHQDLVRSPMFVSLSCLYRPQCYVLGIYLPDRQGLVLRSMAGWLLLSGLFLVIMVAGFAFSVRSMLKQKKLSQMKTDFVNNMTHEFKTPISTISLAGEMLMNPVVTASEEKTRRYGSIILNEITRLKNQVEQVLQIAVLEKGELRLRRRMVDVHRVLEGILKSFAIVVKKREGYIITKLEATQTGIFADRDHLENVIHNLLDNAEKYSPESPVITVSTRNENEGIVISIEDSGIGISQEAQKHIFSKMYRVPTGNIHNVRGFGLGLYYASVMTQAHGGSIRLKSELRKGSKFELYFPFGNETEILQDYEGQNSEDSAY